MFAWDSTLESYRSYLNRKGYLGEITGGIDRAREEITGGIRAAREEILAGIDDQTSQLVGSQEEIQRVLSDDLGALRSAVGTGLSEVAAAFNWGFSDLLVEMGRMNDTLHELIKIARTPTQTAALEHFEIARENHRRGLFEECLEELQKAIAGDQASSGYKTEWRFHQLRGIVLLGSFRSGGAGLDDPARAEEAFLTAARYARADAPGEAARAMLSAGFAAYVQGRTAPEKMRQALAHTEAALALSKDFGEALFQASKVHMALGEAAPALPFLRRAIDLDPGYVVRAVDDPDHRRHDDAFLGFLQALLREVRMQAASEAEQHLAAHRESMEIAPALRGHPAVRRLAGLARGEPEWIAKPLLDILRYHRTGLQADARELGVEVDRLRAIQEGQSRARSVLDRHQDLLATSADARNHPARVRLTEFSSALGADMVALHAQFQYAEQALAVDERALGTLAEQHWSLVAAAQREREALAAAALRARDTLAQQALLLTASQSLREEPATGRLRRLASGAPSATPAELSQYLVSGIESDLRAFEEAVRRQLSVRRVVARRRVATSEVEQEADEPFIVTVDEELNELVRVDLLGRVVAGPQSLPAMLSVSPGKAVLGYDLPVSRVINIGMERPRRWTVLVKRAFEIGCAPVSQALWDLLSSDTEKSADLANKPVERVTWHQAVAFCNILSTVAGMSPVYQETSGSTWECDPNSDGYRLPTEAEWTLACQFGHSAWQRSEIFEWCWDLDEGGPGSSQRTPHGNVRRVAMRGAWDGVGLSTAIYWRDRCLPDSTTTPNLHANIGLRVARSRAGS